MSKLVYKCLLIATLIAAITFMATPAYAQCPMCRMSAETNLANGGSEGKGLNQGILYLLATPYILVCVGGFIWYRNRNRREEEEDRYADMPEA